MQSIYKKFISVGLLAVLFEFAFVRSAHASLFDIASLSTNVITKALLVVIGILAALAQKIFMGGGMLIELAMRLNNNILDPESNKFLFNGWTVFVNVADLALVVGLIIIAFATMLNSQSYGMQKALPKLIVIALLVNFSLVIPGVFLDMSGMATEFFANQSGLTGDNMSSALASAFDISGLLSTSGVGGQGAMNSFGTAMLMILISGAFVVIFTLVASVIMLTIAMMMFVRYFMLTFLLTLTPIIFVAWIFPGTKKHWDKWWNDFVRWTMFPPVMIFFMWLSLTSLSALQGNVGAPAVGTAAAVFGDGLAPSMSGSIIQMVMAVMLMIMSLIAANSISVSGAKGGKDMMGSMTGWGQGKIQKWGRGAKGAATGAAVGAAAYGKRESMRLRNRAATGISSKLGVAERAEKLRKYESENGGFRGRIAGAAGRMGGAISKEQQAAVKKTFDEKFGKMSEDDLALRYSTMGPDEKVFAMDRLVKANKVDKINETVLERDIETMGPAFAQYGDGKAHGKMEKAAGKSAGMVKASKAKKAAMAKMPAGSFGADGKAVSDEAKAVQKELDDAMAKFYEGFTTAQDYANAPAAMYAGDSEFAQEARKRMVAEFPGAIAKVAGKIKDKEKMAKFASEIRAVHEESQKEAMALLVEVASADMDSMKGVDMTSMKDVYEQAKKHASPTQLQRLKDSGHEYQKLINRNKSFENSMASRLFESGEEKKA